MRLHPLLIGVALAGLVGITGAAEGQAHDGQARDSQVSAQAAGTGRLSGRITMAGTGQPVDGVRVTISGAALQGSRTILTDDEGEFAFSELPAGAFTIRATLTGHIAGAWGQRSPGRSGATLVLAAGEVRRDISFEIAKGGVISGIVLDERNRPAIGTPVRVMRWLMQSGERTLVTAGTGSADDRGLYRIFNLPPGDYLVSAVPRNASAETETTVQMQRAEELRALGLMGTPPATMSVNLSDVRGRDTSVGYAPVFYPGTPDLETATVVRLGLSEERLGVDFALRQVRLSNVTGHVVMPAGQNPTTVTIRLLPPDGATSGLPQLSVRPSQNGAFTIPAVAPGRYVVLATAIETVAGSPESQVVAPSAIAPPGPQAAQRRLWAQTDLFVEGEYAPIISLSLQEGVNVSGHLMFDGASVPQGSQRPRVTMSPLGQMLQSAGVGSWNTDVEPGGRFTLRGVIPGRYRVGVTGVAGWQVRSVLVNGIDVLDFPFVIGADGPAPEVSIRLGDRLSEVRGRLTDATGLPTAEYSVVIFADDSRYWIPHARRMRSTRPASDGAFAFAGLPAGDYRLAAVTDVEPGEWFDPEFLRQLLPVSISVRLIDGQPVIQDIRVR